MAEQQESGGGNVITRILTRKIGPAPVWVYFIIVVLGLAWYIRSRQQKAASQQQSPNASDVTGLGGVLDQLALAYPMPYSAGDTFVNIKQDATPPAVVNINNTTPAPPATEPPPPVTQPPPPPKQTSITYKIVSGDTLTKIARKYGVTVNALYAANQGTIEAVARQHGFSSSSHGSSKGWWIFPGTALVIPK